jgi:hypothetical protein
MQVMTIEQMRKPEHKALLKVFLMCYRFLRMAVRDNDSLARSLAKYLDFLQHQVSQPVTAGLVFLL